MMKIYWRGFVTGIVVFYMATLLMTYSVELYYYYLQWGAATTDSIEAGPIKLTISNSTDWGTVFKMVLTILSTYAGIKFINKIFK